MNPLPAALAIAAVLIAAPLAMAAPQPAEPIESTGPAPSTPPFIGNPAKAHPVSGVRPAWQDPFMAANPLNSVHNDAWQTDVYTQFGGPLGKRPETLSTSIGRTCITLTFDRKGRLIGSCTSLSEGPALYLLDPTTLDTLPFMQLPYGPPPPRAPRSRSGSSPPPPRRPARPPPRTRPAARTSTSTTRTGSCWPRATGRY